MIYLFIAGSYTPWLQLKHINGPSAELRFIVCLCVRAHEGARERDRKRMIEVEKNIYVKI